MTAAEGGFKKKRQGIEWSDGDGRFFAPLGTATSGRLVCTSGASGITLRAGAPLSALVRGSFPGRTPHVQASDGVVTVHCPHFPLLDWLLYAREPAAQIALNASLPWELEFRQGVSRLIAHLPELELRSVDILGGASQVTLLLSRPKGTAFIYLAGGVSRLSIYRPSAVGARLQIHGGASSVELDGQHVSGSGAGVHLESAGFSQAVDRYEIAISGGASKVIIGRGGKA